MARPLRPGPGVAGLGLALALFNADAPASAQEMRDSLQDVVRERLERLTRPLGDTTGLLPVDSVDNNLGMVATDDSTLLELLALPGYDLVQYRGQSATFETRSRLLTLFGADGNQAIMNREGLELAADSALVFNENTGRLVTMGEEATYRPEEGDEVVTRKIIFDMNEDRGTATDVRTQMDSGLGNWIVRGDFPWVNADVSFGHDVMFTSCEEDEPHYHFVAREIKLTPGGTLVARNVLLYFSDVGVMWLPFIAQSTEQGRRSGLLPIRFSVNDIVRTSGGYSRRLSNLGFYWAINDYVDTQASVDWWSGNYTALTGAMQFRWLRQFMESDVNFRQFWRNEGGSELAFDTNYNWEISERMQLRLSGRYASSAAFVRRNSFDPREVTQSIDSDGGFNRRFDWGTLSLSANRRQFLSDDRVEMTLPTANLSLSTITLFPAPFNRARFYNNATLSASMRASRSIRDLPSQMLSDEPFSLSQADETNMRGGLSATLSAGAFSISQSLDLKSNTKLDLPGNFFDPDKPAPRAGIGSVGDLQRSVLVSQSALDPIDFGAQELTWSTSVNYQQNLVGSTTITPQLSVSGRSIQSDTSMVAGGGFIAAPRRISFGAQLKSDIYGFFLNERLRHKLSPSFDFAWSPQVTPSAVQVATFGNRAIQPKKELRFGITQTFEMRVDDEESDSTAAAATAAPDPSGGPRRLPQSQKVTVLALRTSAVTYDFEQASELGHFTRGFADNLRISHQISSDYLRGLSLSLEHYVFDDAAIAAAGGARSFSPFVSNVNLGFSMGNNTGLFRWLRGLTGGEVEEDDESQTQQSTDQAEDVSDPSGFENEDLGESTIVPGGRRDRGSGQRRTQGEVGKWDASISYSLARERAVGASDNQMVQGTLNFQPTEKWSVRWRTSYDVVTGAFNDHMISLQREMHRWEADFSFRQTATGNWTFLFEVALTDNRDLHFDYEQRTGGEEIR